MFFFWVCIFFTNFTFIRHMSLVKKWSKMIMFKIGLILELDITPHFVFLNVGKMFVECINFTYVPNGFQVLVNYQKINSFRDIDGRDLRSLKLGILKYFFCWVLYWWISQLWMKSSYLEIKNKMIKINRHRRVRIIRILKY